MGPVEFDVTDAVLALGREAALAIEDDRRESDALREYAPGWAQNWPGPFRIEVESAIYVYFNGEDDESRLLRGELSA
jgi:hypothetical protein